MLTIKTPKRRQWRRFSVFTVNFEHILLLFLLFFIVHFEQVNISWDTSLNNSIAKSPCEFYKTTTYEYVEEYVLGVMIFANYYGMWY